MSLLNLPVCLSFSHSLALSLSSPLSISLLSSLSPNKKTDSLSTPHCVFKRLSLLIQPSNLPLFTSSLFHYFNHPPVLLFLSQLHGEAGGVGHSLLAPLLGGSQFVAHLIQVGLHGLDVSLQLALLALDGRVLCGQLVHAVVGVVQLVLSSLAGTLGLWITNVVTIIAAIFIIIIIITIPRSSLSSFALFLPSASFFLIDNTIIRWFSLWASCLSCKN